MFVKFFETSTDIPSYFSLAILYLEAIPLLESNLQRNVLNVWKKYKFI